MNITPSNFATILNEDLKATGLPLIPENYTESTADMAVLTGMGNLLEEEAVTTYDFEITETIVLRLMAFKSLNNGIPVIEIIQTNTTAAEKDLSLLHEYFQVICQNVEPQFNSGKFNINTFANKNYTMNGLLFWCGYFNRSDSEKTPVYLISTNEDLFSFY